VGRRPVLALVTLLSCREPTQITVVLRGEGFECASTERPTSFVGSSLLASPQVPRSYDAAAAPRWTECVPGSASDDRVELGDVVLVPSDGGAGPVEITAFASIRTAQGSTEVEECIALYDAYRRDPSSAGGGPEGERPFDRCIVARRSLGFVQHSSLQLEIPLSSACAGKICPASQTCVAGECRSASASCGPEGCDLEGGAGPGLGGGGAGGGVLWTELIVPSSPSPFVDVVAYEEGETLHVWLAAGGAIHHLEDSPGEAPELVASVSNPDPRAFLAVAKETGGTRVAAIGAQGIWRSDLAGPPSTPPEWPAFANTAARFDLAWPRPSAAISEDFVWAYELGDACEVVPNLFGTEMQGCGVAVATSDLGDRTAFATVRGARLQVGVENDGNLMFEVPLQVAMASADWSLWLRNASTLGPARGVAAKPEAPAAVFHFEGEAAEQRVDTFVSEAPHADVDLVDLGVLDRGETLELFAVTSSGLLHATIPATVAPAGGEWNLAWSPVESLPPMEPRALWVGHLSPGFPGTRPRIVVAGERDGQGVAHWADVDGI
jgi:hypothetical protein